MKREYVNVDKLPELPFVTCSGCGDLAMCKPTGWKEYDPDEDEWYFEYQDDNGDNYYTLAWEL